MSNPGILVELSPVLDDSTVSAQIQGTRRQRTHSMSSEEAPPPPPPLLEDKWVKIQENTFTNWVNQQLSDTEYQIESLDG